MQRQLHEGCSSLLLRMLLRMLLLLLAASARSIQILLYRLGALLSCWLWSSHAFVLELLLLSLLLLLLLLLQGCLLVC